MLGNTKAPRNCRRVNKVQKLLQSTNTFTKNHKPMNKHVLYSILDCEYENEVPVKI